MISRLGFELQWATPLGRNQDTTALPLTSLNIYNIHCSTQSSQDFIVYFTTIVDLFVITQRQKVKIKYGETRQSSKRDCKKETISQQRRYIFGNSFSSSSNSFIQISHCTNFSISVILQPIDLQNCLYFSCCSTEIA